MPGGRRAHQRGIPALMVQIGMSGDYHSDFNRMEFQPFEVGEDRALRRLRDTGVNEKHVAADEKILKKVSPSKQGLNLESVAKKVPCAGFLSQTQKESSKNSNTEVTERNE